MTDKQKYEPLPYSDIELHSVTRVPRAPRFGYEYYTWFELTMIAICTIAVGVCIAVVAMLCGVAL
jgi:hypothetical protein